MTLVADKCGACGATVYREPTPWTAQVKVICGVCRWDDRARAKCGYAPLPGEKKKRFERN